MLRPWNAERGKLAGLQPPKGQEEVAKKILEYMLLKGQGWLLAAQGVRANDSGLTQKATAKLTEASELAKSLGGKAR